MTGTTTFDVVSARAVRSHPSTSLRVQRRRHAHEFTAAVGAGSGYCPDGLPSSTSGDTTKPSVSLAASSTNVTTAGTVTLTATASDNVGVTKVEFYDGSTLLGEDTRPGDGFTQTVTLSSNNNGSKSYTAKAFDAAGNTLTSAAVTVAVAIPVDTTGPTLLSSTALTNTSVRLVFSEAIVGGDNPLNFTIFPTLNVTGASVSGDAKTVTLTTAPQTANQSYAVLVRAAVTDLAGNPFDSAGTQPFATSFTGIGANPGSLAVTIAGLPAGVAADVTVSGPNNFIQKVTQVSSVLSNLKSGVYSFAVNAVKPDSATFSDAGSPASLSFDANVGGSATLTYGCSSVKPPDTGLDGVLQVVTGKAAYNCADLAKRMEIFPNQSSFKGITNLKGLQYATGLASIDLSYNQIGVLPPGIFDGMKNLGVLSLVANNISTLPTGIFDKLELATLDLSINPIGTLPTGIFDKLTNLNNLFLYHDGIKTLPIDIFDKFINLKYNLDLGSNNIDTFPVGTFDNLTQLIRLYLDHNNFTVLPDGFAKLTALSSLSLTGNSLSALPNSLVSRIPAMSRLELKENCFATEQNPIKAALTGFTGTLLKDGNPKAGCPQKTISLASIKASVLTGSRNNPTDTDTVVTKITIDGVDQGDLGVGEHTVNPGNTVTINKTIP